ncbi:hypothetical protein HHK36_003088 [Tetracentron sinense]|uniref:Uncharacterized protein n=1 Tax=Tetracentron sinense TaxID=13715 RepID=A0A834ZXP0_TETSI|nr:hypothetical protein HHK36_003088 [Tetracentron sinense]
MQGTGIGTGHDYQQQVCFIAPAARALAQRKKKGMKEKMPCGGQHKTSTTTPGGYDEAGQQHEKKGVTDVRGDVGIDVP